MKVTTSDNRPIRETMKTMEYGRLYQIFGGSYDGIIVIRYSSNMVVNLSEPGCSEFWNNADNMVVECKKDFSITLTQD